MNLRYWALKLLWRIGNITIFLNNFLNAIPPLYNFVPYRSRLSFAIWLIFKNDCVRVYVEGLAVLEAGANPSKLAVVYNNWFGMAYVQTSDFQSGKTPIKKIGEPIFASYENVFDAVYDLYDLVYERRKVNGVKVYKEVFDKAPSNFDGTSTAYRTWIISVVYTFHKYGYHTSAAGPRQVFFHTMAKTAKVHSNFYVFAITLPVLAILALIIYLCRLFKKAKAKEIQIAPF